MSGPVTLLSRVRACGLVRKDGRLLLVREDGDDFWTLPGGAVEPGEFSAEALKRELGEELGVRSPRIGPLLLVCENHFRWRGRAYQEVVMGFAVELDPGSASFGDAPFRGSEPHLVFCWFDMAAVAKLDLRPSVVQALVTGSGADGTIRHHCLREDEDPARMAHEPTGGGRSPIGAPER